MSFILENIIRFAGLQKSFPGPTLFQRQLSNFARNNNVTGRTAKSAAAIMAAVAALAFLCSSALCAEPGTLTILHTNDIHSRLVPFDHPQAGKRVGGIERLAAYFASVKKETPRVLVVDAGDASQGTPFYNFFRGEAEFSAMVAAGYDFAAVGNHEFDSGIENLMLQAKKSGLKLLCSNLFDAATGRPLFTPFAFKNIGGTKVAVVGVMGKEAWDTVSQQFKKGVLHADEFDFLKRLCPMLARCVDAVVLLSHSGHAVDLRLAASVPGIDVVVGAHTHTKIEKPVAVSGAVPGRTVPVVQAFENGIYAGRLDVRFDAAGRPCGFEGGIKLMDRGVKGRADERLRRIVSRYDGAIRRKISRKIGFCEAEMSHYLTDLFTALDHPLGRFVCDALKAESGADVFFANSTMIRDRMPKGDITLETVYRIIPFDNGVAVFEMNGAALLRMADVIAANFGKNESFQYGGISFRIDASKRSASGVLVGGKPVDPQKTYKVATSSYIAQGNLNGPEMFREASSRADGGNLRDMLIRFIEKSGRIIPPSDERIKVIK